MHALQIVRPGRHSRVDGADSAHNAQSPSICSLIPLHHVPPESKKQRCKPMQVSSMRKGVSEKKTIARWPPDYLTSQEPNRKETVSYSAHITINSFRLLTLLLHCMSYIDDLVCLSAVTCERVMWGKGVHLVHSTCAYNITFSTQ